MPAAVTRRADALLYLHGIGNRASVDIGELLAEFAPEVTEVPILAPGYLDLIREPFPDEVAAKTPRTRTVNDPAAKAAYFREQGRLERRFLRVQGRPPVPGALFRAVQRILTDAETYLTDEARRQAVRSRLVDLLASRGPDVGHLVIVAHSLGSVVAADLVQHLPPSVRTVRLVTIGSPLRIGQVQQLPEMRRLREQFPYDHVLAWANLSSFGDPITAAGPLGAVYSEAVDVGVDIELGHGMRRYLAHPTSQEVIRDAVLGPPPPAWSTDRSLVPALDADERRVLFALHYAAAVERHLRGGVRERFRIARHDVDTRSRRRLTDLRHRDGRAVPPALSEPVLPLGLDGTEAVPADPSESTDPDHIRADHLTAVLLCATTNLVEPYQIAVGSAPRRAIADLWRDLGYPEHQGALIEQTLREAEAALAPPQTLKRAGLIATGLALVAVPGVGVALAGGAVAGASAITAGLAAFGPGGVAGGLLLSGGLISLGGAATTAGLMVRDLDAASVAAEAVRQMTLAEAKRRLDLPGPGGTPVDLRHWAAIDALAGATTRQLAQHRDISDKSSSTVKDLQTKHAALARAQAWMQRRGLAPVAALESRAALEAGPVGADPGAPIEDDA